ncbi:MAG: hypothetical protein L6R40_003979 [Gallowayella cf. fulva]|nr:MAG: hypothetical protein L6R40_003979 [Xanthomendoza cf. fulva]
MFMDLPVSGIHRLFTAASSHSSQPYKPPPLESVTEESHTYDLLYPDFNALQHSQHQPYPLPNANPSSLASAANSFDDRGGLDIHSPHHVRIIVAQDGIFSQPAKVIFDTHPPPALPAARLGSPVDSKAGTNGENQQPAGLSRRTNTMPESPTKSKHTRFSSLNQVRPTSPVEQRSPLSPLVEPQGIFGNPRPRQSSARPCTSEGETHQAKLAREGKEELEGLLDSMFGSTGSTMLSGTKMHVRPAGTIQTRSSSQYEANTRSPEPGVARRKGTPLTRSTTAPDTHHMSASAPTESVDLSRPQSPNPSVVITRVFTLDPSEVLSPSLTADQTQTRAANPEDQHQDSQFPRKPSMFSETVPAKQVKCPAYALSLILQLPINVQQGWSSASQTMSPLFPGSPCPSIFARDGHWKEETPFGSAPYSLDRTIEQVTRHWSLIVKLLDYLETVMRKRISALLADIDLSSPTPSIQPSTQVSNKGLNGGLKSPVKAIRRPNQPILQLPANALQNLEDVQHCVTRFGERVAVALRTRQVITGQERWSIWREEARWVGRWAGSRDQNFFFFNLLTAFLGSHTDWMESLVAPRTRQFYNRHVMRKEASHINRRQTVIVSTDKMAARRLIFLLSAFLAGTAPVMQDSFLVPSVPWTGTSFPSSPPSGITVLRKQSLRREINRRQRGNRASQAGTGSHGRSMSFASPENTSDKDGESVFQYSNGQHVRRASDTKSIRSPALPTATSDETTRKSSTTTSSTIVPDGPLPVAHFSNIARDPLGTAPAPRPGSSGSLASLSLKHNLHRSESNEHSTASTGSQSFSRWGSMVSGFWSGRRGSSTDDNEFVCPPANGLGISGISKMPAYASSPGTLSRMVEEAETVSQLEQQKRSTRHRLPEFPDSAIVGDIDFTDEQTTAPQSTEATPVTEPPKVEPSAVKISVDEQDGVLDIEIDPSSSCDSSFASSFSSMGFCHTAANSFNERSPIFPRSVCRERSLAGSASVTDVAGWLKEYNQDFTLQAVKPYQSLYNDIKEAMKSESAAQSSMKRAKSIHTATTDWSDVMTTLVANTKTFSIIRISLQHRCKKPNQPSSGLASLQNSESGNPTIEERIIEDPIMDMDPTLIDAVERVLAQSGHSSRVQSRTASRAPSPSRAAHRSPGIQTSRSHTDFHSTTTPPYLEVPKSECKRLVLGALEEVVRSVQAEQDAGLNGARRISGEPVRSGEEMIPPDTTLREGVRRWLRGTGVVEGG